MDEPNTHISLSYNTCSRDLCYFFLHPCTKSCSRGSADCYLR